MANPDPGSFGVYVHVPWCRTRCPYCAFNVHVDPAAPWEAWARGIAEEWAETAPRFGAEALAHSVYFGGGTPSLAPVHTLSEILAVLPRAPRAEITLEANPGTLDAAKLAALRTAGVNRLSLGIQTFDERFAHVLNRGHTVRQARELVAEVARADFRSWSVDIIFALPGQSLADLAVDLGAILELEPPHVSLYGLTFEPETPFGRAAARGRMRPPEPELWREQYDHIVRTLEAGGWQRYEVSNFARPGHRAVHNEAVWRGGHYAGLGPGAHGFFPDGTRTLNAPDPVAWRMVPQDRQRPTAAEAAIDLVLSTLRHCDGLTLPALETHTGHRVHLDALAPLLRPRRGPPLLVVRGESLLLTPDGYPLADGVVARVCEALEPVQIA